MKECSYSLGYDCRDMNAKDLSYRKEGRKEGTAKEPF